PHRRRAVAFAGLRVSAVAWEELATRRPGHTALTAAARHSHCKRLAAEGDLARACTALTAPPALAPSPDTLVSLQAKHPQAPDLSALGSPRPGAVPDFEIEAVAQAVQGFKRGSAPGPSGLRADHLREALLSAHADEVATDLTGPRVAGLLLASASEVGVGVPSGCDVAVHATRAWLHHNSGHADKILVKLDFRNAFNSVDRTALLRAVRADSPECACWADWCYGCSSRLLFGDSVIQSTCGVQQGDPLRPLFFALVLQPALAAAEGPLDLRYAFLDDVVLAGSSVPVCRALDRLTAEAARVGLVLEPTKSEVVVPNSGICPLASCGVAASLSCWAPLLAGPPTATMELPDAQTALLLLRYCASHVKLVHAARVTPPPLHEPALLEFDERVRSCLEHIGALTLTQQAWRQACLKVRLGGLGLRSASRHAPAAYIAYVSACAAACSQLDPNFRLDLSQPVATYNAAVAAGDRVPPAPQHVRQQQLSAALDAAELAAIQ
ncbi:unnamed protein product, partial [Symbiodinium pilosum]